MRYSEENARAEQMGAGIALGCGIIVFAFIVLIFIGAILSSG